MKHPAAPATAQGEVPQEFRDAFYELYGLHPPYPPPGWQEEADADWNGNGPASTFWRQALASRPPEDAGRGETVVPEFDIDLDEEDDIRFELYLGKRKTVCVYWNEVRCTGGVAWLLGDESGSRTATLGSGKTTISIAIRDAVSLLNTCAMGMNDGPLLREIKAFVSANTATLEAGRRGE